MTEPMRIQRKRTKGWRLPENTCCVDRSTMWGNHHRIGDVVDGIVIDAPMAVRLFEEDIITNAPRLRFKVKDLWKLKGKNLACYCGLDQICHADVLLRWANSGN